MISEQDRQFLLDEYQICSSKRKPFSKYLENEFRKRNPDLYEKIVQNTKYMSKSYTFEHRLFMYINQYDDFPICSSCGKRKVISKNIGLNGYQDKDLICHYCVAASKTKQTTIKKYGVINVSKLSKIKDKKKETVLKHFGVDNPSKVESIQQKKKDSNLIKYGTEYASQCDFVKSKIKKSLIKKYGVDNVSKIDLIKKKKRKTCIQNYGVEYPTKSDVIKEKIKNKIRSNPNFYNNRLKKQQKKCFEIYGHSHWMKSDEYRRLFSNMKHKESYRKILISKYVVPQFDENFFVKNFDKELTWKCKKCGDIFSTIDDNCVLNMPLFVRCPKCYPLEKQTSSYENEIVLFLKDLNIDCIQSDKNLIPRNYEIDINIPEKKLAIEFDGLYWHNEFRKSTKYHLIKTKLCEDIGYQLIHIFEDEWVNKEEIVKARLKNLLGIYDKTIYARKCEIGEIDNLEAKKFIDDNHLQGYTPSSIHIGLIYENQLVSLMSFGSYRKAVGSTKKDNEYEMIRFCSKLGYHIPGAASRLLKYFINSYQPTNIISYADRRWSQGKLYEKLGFKFLHDTKPNYWYIVNGKREHRFSWRKSELLKKFPDCDASKTEHEIMLEHNIARIYDCGSKKFELII